MGRKILFIIPPFREGYSQTPIQAGVPSPPPLWPAALAPALLSAGHEVKVFDYSISRHPGKELAGVLRFFLPEVIGIGFLTPQAEFVKKLVSDLRRLCPDSFVIGGGAHSSALPRETLEEIPFDAVVVGEGDFALAGLLASDSDPLDQKILIGKSLQNLDELPLPAWEIFDISRYRNTHMLTRKNPVGWIETSRGCPHECPYCTKAVFGRGFRPKSPPRVIREIRRMLELGFQEIHLVDDNFVTDRGRALEICEQIIRNRLEFPWAPVIGVRVDGLDHELLSRMQRAGCYRICLGIESGSQRILDRIGKKITLEQVEEVVDNCRQLGLETFGYFMIGLPGEDEESMLATIRFARRLNLDLAKISYTIPLPATPLYSELKERGLLRDKNWTAYNLYHPPRDLYSHPNLDWNVVEKYFKKFYRVFYLNPGYFWKRFRFALKNKTLMSDFLGFLRTPW